MNMKSYTFKPDLDSYWEFTIIHFFPKQKSYIIRSGSILIMNNHMGKSCEKVISKPEEKFIYLLSNNHRKLVTGIE